MALPVDRLPYDLNDEEREEYEKLGSETLKKEWLEKRKASKLEKNTESPQSVGNAPSENEKVNVEEITEEKLATEEPDITEEVNEPPPEEPEINPPYPTYIQEQESIKINNWIPLPGVPFVTVFKKLYRCKRHPEGKFNRGSLTSHLRAQHGLDLQGNAIGTAIVKESQNEPLEPLKKENEIELNSSEKLETELPNEEKLENQLKPSDFSSDIANLERQLAQRKREKELAESTEEPEVLVMQSFNAEIAASATKIVQNIDLRFLYEKTKTLWPPEWDFATWITALVTYALNDFKIGATVWQDTDNLDEDKVRFLIQVKKDWEEKLLYEKQQRTLKLKDKVK